MKIDIQPLLDKNYVFDSEQKKNIIERYEKENEEGKKALKEELIEALRLQDIVLREVLMQSPEIRQKLKQEVSTLQKNIQKAREENSHNKEKIELQEIEKKISNF